MQLYNTLGRTVETFEPLEPGKVGLYVCGPTVQARPHLGHGRSEVSFDVIRRYLTWRGYEVTYVRNVTDVEDKIIAAANDEGVAVDELAARYSTAFTSAYAALNVNPPDVEPRATDNIGEMIAIVEKLISEDHAYESDGDVYFSVRSYPEYGRLSQRDIDELLSGARIDATEQKRDPLDFALWKSAKPGEPSWESPWGLGRPGWHIECSAMAQRYLGDTFDIHGGGTDLIFPHHENELAQSEAANHKPFARYWLHNGMLNLKGEKMSKSTGHVIDLATALDTYSPLAVRLFYLRTHYRKPLDFTETALEDAQASLDRLTAFVRRGEGIEDVESDPTTIASFQRLMDDDFDAAGGLGVIFDAVREGNRRMDEGEDAAPLLAAVTELLGVLGLIENARGVDDLEADVQALIDKFGANGDGVDALLARRDEARQNKEWATADGIRDSLAELGIVIEDSADGVRWYRR